MVGRRPQGPANTQRAANRSGQASLGAFLISSQGRKKRCKLIGYQDDNDGSRGVPSRGPDQTSSGGQTG